MLVVDASLTVSALVAERGFDRLGDRRLVAPPLMWSEARSSLHEMQWRRELDAEDADVLRLRLDQCPVKRADHERLGVEAWRIANELGWAKTYDAEYLALGGLLGCRVVTMDRRLRRGADRLDLVISPEEL